MGVLDDIDKREIGDHVGHRQGEIGVGHEAKAHQRDRRRDGHQPLVARDAAPYRQHGIDERERQGEHKRVMAGFDDHARLFGKIPAFVLTSASSFAHACRFRAFPPDALFLQRVGDVARHVALVVFGENAVRLKDFVLGPSVPSATTPCPSRKRSGKSPV